MRHIHHPLAALVLTGILAGAGPTTRESSRADRLRQDAPALTFRLLYVGPLDKPYSSETWGPMPSVVSMNTVVPHPITAAQARAVLDWMETRAYWQTEWRRMRRSR
jgi:hypothetical protein